MKTRQKIVFGLVLLLVVIQFFRPTRNISTEVLSTDMFRVYTAPVPVQALVKTACYDCHSNNTNYPWYAQVQPVGWWLASHIKEGKAEINFSEFGSLPHRRQISKLKDIEGSIRDGSMPLSSYTLIHRNARLTDEEKKMMDDWLSKTRDSLSGSVH